MISNEEYRCVELEERLNFLLPRLVVWPDGTTYQVKELIDNIESLKIYMYPHDHNPPHFHVISKNKEIDAVFDFSSGTVTKGNVDFKNEKKIRFYYEQHRQAFFDAWDRLKK
ncbi:MAG: DUF4160 domain-containing protein [Bacteroidetes bacterium]|nr:DUF4160 domain-containing protein [Bacteroidota bacterium]